MKNFISVFCALTSLAFANEIYQNQAAIDSVYENINSQKGIEVSGTIRSVSYTSEISSKQEKFPEGSMATAINTMPDKEIAEFVQLDLNFLFRPWDNVRANLTLRMGAGMQEYFANAANMVNAPWMNVEGNAANNKFYWAVGDFRQSYSPLTLYSPGIDIMYEPTIYARKREIATGDALLEGNQRNLQGFNLQFRPDFGEKIGELRIEALGARLRRAGFLDSTGAMGNILPNENIPGSLQAGTFDKFLLGGNLELLPIGKNALVGGSYLFVFDDENSAMKRPNGSHINVNDTLPQNTKVFAGRAGFDLAGFLNNNNLVANAVAEYAASNDNVYKFVDDFDENGDYLGIKAKDKFIDGSAILANLNVGYKSSFKAVLSGNFVNNDANWFNPLAQTPQFVPSRILNTDKDEDSNVSSQNILNPNTSKYGVYAPLYSTFDALYNFTPKHSPMSKNLDNMGNLHQTQSYNIAPYAKSSWNASTLTRSELALLEELYDPSLQTALPSGLATANRTGATGTLTLGYGDYIEAQGLFTSLKQLSAVENSKKADYMEFGGGAKIDILGFIGFEKNPLELSGSYKHSLKEQDWKIGDWDNFRTVEYKNDFINAGFYYRFFRRFGLVAGYQRIDSDLNSAGADLVKSRNNPDGGYVGATGEWNIKIVPLVKSVQDQWMAGIDYTLARNAWLSISYGIINVDNTYDSEGMGIVDENGNLSTTGTNLPDYIASVKVGNASKVKHKFTRNVLEAAINVEF